MPSFADMMFNTPKGPIVNKKESIGDMIKARLPNFKVMAK
jgi:hypothetical protein